MPPPGRKRSRSDHELAQALDLSARAAGLSTGQLAKQLNYSDRTIRRYRQAERRPDRDLVRQWAQACGVEPAQLTALHDRAAHGASDDRQAPAQAPHPRRPSLRRAGPLVAAAAAALVGVLGLVLLLGPSSERARSAAVVHASPSRSDVPHHFTPSYTGQVWLRISPTPGRVGSDHRVRVRWGSKENAFTLRRLGAEPPALLLEKNDRGDFTFLVKVSPPAAVDFGEGRPDGAARPIPAAWGKRTAG